MPMDPTHAPSEQYDTPETESTTPMEPVTPAAPVAPPMVARTAPIVEPARTYTPAQYADGSLAPTRGGLAAGRGAQFIYVVLGALDALLIIRFVLKLLAANPSAGFTSFIYGITAPFVLPFQGVFPSPQTNASVLEVSTLLAIIVYALLAWLIVSVIGALTTRRPMRTT